MQWRRLLILMFCVAAVASCSDSESASETDATARTTSAVSGAALPSEQLLYLSPVDERDPEGAWVLVRVLDDVESAIQTPDGGDVEAPDVNSDGTAVVYMVERDDRWSVWSSRLDDSAAAPTELIPTTDLHCPRWFPGSDRIVLVGEDNRIEVLDAGTGTSTVVRGARDERVSCTDPVDERHVVFGLGDEHETPDLWTLDLETSEERLLGSVADGCIINNPAVAPDAAAVVVDAICEDRGNNGLWLIPVEGGSPRPVLQENEAGVDHEYAVQYWAPQWTPDSSALLYHRSGANPASVHKVDVDGTNDSEVVPAFACCPAVGPEVADRDAG